MKGTREERMDELDSAYPVWEKQTIWARFLSCALRFPQTEFIVFDDGSRYTYEEVRCCANRIAAALNQLGVQQGDCIVLKMEPSLEMVSLIFSLAKIGAVKVLVNRNVGPFEFTYIANKVRASYVFLDDERVLASSADCPTVRRTIVKVSNDSAQAGLLPDKVLPWGEFIAQTLSNDSVITVEDPDLLSDIMFTSGSTGNPKGVPLTHDMLQRSAFANCMNRGFERNRRIGCLVPLYHCFGYVEGLLAALFVGATLLIPKRKFEPRKTLRWLRDERANDILCVIYMMLRSCAYLKGNPMSFPALHAMYCAGELAPDTLWADIMDCFGISDVIDGYGMTEICGAMAQTRPGDSCEILKRKVGVVLPAGSAGSKAYGGHLVEYRVVDRDSGESLPDGDVGELYCRGLTVMEGYCREEQANEESFSEDGWLKTGDLGSIDADGYIELFGRVRETYRINGENVSPTFLEQIINRCNAVRRSVVVGVPDRDYGAVGALFVQLTDGANLDEVKQFCRESLARFQVPKYYFCMDEGDWPRTASGKIQRFKLEERAQQETKSKICAQEGRV
ncbi:MAG: class I adenylate-forming enzyme family protein [Eggerthellaceae bacterium]